MNTSQSPRPAASRPRLPPISRATIIGLDGVGRQVALQLAGFVILRLQLIDSRVVEGSTCAVEGFLHDDIARLRVHATAEACHEVNPMLEIHTLNHPFKADDWLEQAVFCCGPPDETMQWWGESFSHRITFAAMCHRVDTTIRLNFATNARVPANGFHQPIPDVASHSGTTMPLHVAAIAAGLMVGEFARLADGQLPAQAIHFDPQTPSLQVQSRS